MFKDLLPDFLAEAAGAILVAFAITVCLMLVGWVIVAI